VGRRPPAGEGEKGKGMSRRKVLSVLFVVAVAAAVLGSASVAVAAYEHEDEIDSGIFLAVHPEAKGTKLDSCALCHSGGSITGGGKTTVLGSCQWCHEVFGYTHPHKGTLDQTLNSYGRAYLVAGRNIAAVNAIEGGDADGDGYANGVEIAAVRFPGDAADDPSKVAAPSRVYTLAELKTLPAHTQFLLMSAAKSTDDYTTYTGVPVDALLKNARLLSTANNVKAFSPDGFATDHPLNPPAVIPSTAYPVRMIYPQGMFWYDAVADIALNPTVGWVNYSDPGCAARTNGSPIVVSGGLQLILAYARAGAPLAPGVLNLAVNKLDGEGPFRMVPPQKVPSVPDQRSANSSSTLIWPYDRALDKNAGYSNRSVTILKVEPLPAGTTDINTMEAGWNYVDEGKVVVYGAIDPVPSARAKVRALAAFVKASSPNTFRGRRVVRATLSNKITALDKRLSKRQVKQVIHEIEKHLLKKVDGVPRRGTHRWDWIKNKQTQAQVYWGLKEVVTLLRAAE
jgi:hypothetical protein